MDAYLVINNIMAQKHNKTARTEKIFDSSATDINKVLILSLFHNTLSKYFWSALTLPSSQLNREPNSW